MASILWEPNVVEIVYGELIEESIFSATAIYLDSDGDEYSPDGTYEYTYSGDTSGILSAGTKLDAGGYTLTVTFTPNDGTLSPAVATADAGFSVLQAVPKVTWNNPSDIKYNYKGGNGPQLSSEQLNAVADVGGTFVYSPASGTELNAGSHIVTATFTPTDEVNYEPLDSLQIVFKVLKGDVEIDWDFYENGVSKIRKVAGGGSEITPHVLQFDDAKALSLGSEVPGTFEYSPVRGTELTESTNITATFTPTNPDNWNNASVTLPFTVHKTISGPNIAPTMFGCYVQSVSASVGWGGNSSTCDLTLVEDPDNNKIWEPPEVGAACYFQYKGFFFGGVFTRWSYAESTAGRTYKVLLESPAKLLDGVQVIMDSFEGTEYNFDFGDEYNRFRPSSQNPNITTEVNNVYNALGHFENHTFGGLFGRADTNSVGFPANKLLETIEILSCPDENEDFDFAHRCVFGEQEYYKIDLSQIKEIAPDFYRIAGVSQSVNGIISDVTELVQHDYFVTLEADEDAGKLEPPIGGEDGDDGGGTITNPNIKIVAISKGSQPNPGAIRSLVDAFKQDGKTISSSIGQELQDDTTQKIIIGGQGSRLVTRRTIDAYPIWAKKSDSSYIFDFSLNRTPNSYQDRNPIPVWVDPFSFFSSYAATVFELRMATAGRNAWQTFKVFESVAKGTYENDPWCVDIDVDPATLQVLALGNRGPLHLSSTSKKTANKSYNTKFQENFAADAAEYTDKIFTAVQNTANNFYGKMFAIPMPEEPGGLENNIRFITEDQKYETSWEAVDSAFDPAFRFNDVSFFDPNGRTKTYVEWTYSPVRDFSALGSNYAGYYGNMFTQNEDQLINIGRGVASTGCTIEKSAYFFDFGGGFKPFVVMNAGSKILEYDSKTTPDFGLTVLAKYFFNIDIPPEKYIGPGKPNTKITIPPNIVPPHSFGIAQQSNRYVWGPWIGGSLKGKTEVITDDSLVPESFGSADGMNQAGEALAKVGNAEMAASETGYVEIAEFPAYNIAERFAGSGPYVSDMSFTIDTSGFKTTYKFNTWTPQFGRLAKYNVDRIARINKASLELAQRERARITKRPFLPPPNPKMTAEDLIDRLNRQDISLSLGQVFPPGGGLDGTWSVSDVSVSDLGPLAEGGGVYDKVAGASRDNNYIPVHTAKSKTKNNNMPSLENPSNSSEPDGLFPDSKALDPYFSTKVNEDDGSETFSRITLDGLVVDPAPEDFSPDKMDKNQKRAVTAVRTMSQTFPMIAAGWGYDVAFNPVPNDGSDFTKFDKKFQQNPALRKAGPVRLLWDDERKIWAGGPEVVCGKLASDISNPESPDQATTFTIQVFKKTSDTSTKGTGALSSSGGTLTVYNRDPTLKQKKGENTFVMAIRVNYEWLPLWVGCPEENEEETEETTGNI